MFTRTLHALYVESRVCCALAYGVQLYDHLRHRCATDQVHDIVSEAVVIEKEFLTDALPCALIGINAGVSDYSPLILLSLIVLVDVPIH